MSDDIKNEIKDFLALADKEVGGKKLLDYAVDAALKRFSKESKVNLDELLFGKENEQGNIEQIKILFSRLCEYKSKIELILWLSEQPNGNGKETLYDSLLKNGLSKLVSEKDLDKYIIKRD